MALSRPLARLLSSVALAATLGASGVAAAQADAEITLPDASLAACVREALGVEPSAPITADAISRLTWLSCGEGIVSIEGLEHATALTSLAILPADSLASVESIAHLPALEELSLPFAGPIDLGPLSQLPVLTYLDLYGASVSELPVLPGLTVLDAGDSAIDSLAPLTASSSLSVLWVDGTAVSDLSPLAGHGALAELVAADAEISSLGPLHHLAALEYLDVSGNHIADASALASLPALADYDLTGQLLPGLSASRCVPLSTPSAVGVDGASLPLAGPGAYAFGAQTLFTSAGPRTLTFDDGDRYSGSLPVTVASGVSPCAWPAGSTATVTVTGSAEVGGTLVARITETNPLTPAGAATTTIGWRTFEGGVPLGSGSTYRPTADYAGERIVAVAITTAPGMATRTVASAPTSTVKALLPNVPLAWASAPVEGLSASPDTAALSVGDLTFTCAYLVDGKVAATDSSCAKVVPSTWAGRSLAIRLTASGPRYVTRDYTTPTVTVLRSLGPVQWVYDFTGVPASGTAVVGTTLTANPPLYAVTPSSYTYQWTRNSIPIGGATGRSYQATSSDAGKALGVAITAKRSGYLSSTWVTWEVSVAPSLKSTAAPTIAGTPAQGVLLTASTGGWSPSPGGLTYRWFRGTTPISGATSRTYRATSADVGQVLKVKVTATRAGYSPTVRWSAGVTIGRKLTTGAPSVVGTVKVGQTVSARSGVWGPGTVSRALAWRVGSSYIAQGWTYTLKPTDAFKQFRLRVTGSKPGYATESRWTSIVTVQGLAYTSCSALRAHYPGGVARASTVKNVSGGAVVGGVRATTFVSAPEYELNARLDPDKDGWACE